MTDVPPQPDDHDDRPILPRHLANVERRRYRLVIAYDGAAFHGWQKQEPPDQEPLRTVQGVVEAALSRLLMQRLNLFGASRTDRGVHALGQVAQFDASCPIPLERFLDAANSRLPDDVEIRDVAIAPDGFDCIKHATCKQYRYRLFNSNRRPLQQRHYVSHCWYDLDVDRMNDAAARLIGTHDFAGFAAAKHGRLSTVRTIFKCHVERHEGDDPEVHVVVSGNGFLYNMVRIITGTLVEVGRGAMPPTAVDDAIAHANRRLAGPTMQPEGLWLEWIRYDAEHEIETVTEQDAVAAANRNAKQDTEQDA